MNSYIKALINDEIKILENYKKNKEKDLKMAVKYNEVRNIRILKYGIATIQAEITKLKELLNEEEEVIISIAWELRELSRDMVQVYQEIKQRGERRL